jgi:hypothetical protein
VNQQRCSDVTTRWVRWRWLYAATLLIFVSLILRFCSHETGFTSLILFGEKNQKRFLPELSSLDYFVEDGSRGYDAQWYAQLAMRPRLDDPLLAEAMDNLPYRARRILLAWTAYLMGMGQPAWIVQIYALQNAVCWLILAWLLLRWFGPWDANNLIRWWGILFSNGLLTSVRCSLVDGPSLLLIAWGMMLIESKRPWLASLVMGIGGLGKETNVLSAAGFADPAVRTWKSCGRIIVQGILVVLPVAIWTAVVVWILGPVGMDAGSRNFGPPFVELWRKMVTTAHELVSWPARPHLVLSNLFMLVALLTQFFFIVLRPQWKNPWWRVGAVYAGLMVVLGEAVWEGHPGAATRVLLPLLLVFNVLVPRGRRWLAILILGNLTVISGPPLLMTPAGFNETVTGLAELRQDESSGRWLKVRFGENWFPPAQTIWDHWRWSEGDASITLVNPHPKTLLVKLDFKMTSLSARDVHLEIDGERLWGQFIDGERRPASLQILLKPGETKLDFVTPQPSDDAGDPKDDRKLGFRLFDFKVTALELR